MLFFRLLIYGRYVKIYREHFPQEREQDTDMRKLTGFLKAAGCAATLGIVWFALAYTCAGSVSMPVRYISTAVVLLIVGASVSLIIHSKLLPKKWMNLIIVAAAFGVFLLLIGYRDLFFEQLVNATREFL